MTTGDAGGTLGGDTVKTVFNTAALDAFRANFVYRRCADVKWAGGPGAEPMPGVAVTFTIISAMAVATTALTEATEPTPVNVSDTQKTVTLVEYGNATKQTKKLRLTSFLGLDMTIPREVASNMEESMDIIARDVLVAGTNVFYGGAVASRVTVAAGTTITANNIRRGRNILARNNTPFPAGSSMYIAFIHPDVSYDLQVESGQAAWSAPHVYQDTDAMYTGELGALGGVRIVENANAKVFADAGVGSTVDVYVTLFVGLQALGEAVAESQHMVISGPFDDLQRFTSVGWYALEGFGRVRENSLARLETSSSLGVNV
jgi:N4-gp56 family major capsid protein